MRETLQYQRSLEARRRQDEAYDESTAKQRERRERKAKARAAREARKEDRYSSEEEEEQVRRCDLAQTTTEEVHPGDRTFAHMAKATPEFEAELEAAIAASLAEPGHAAQSRPSGFGGGSTGSAGFSGGSCTGFSGCGGSSSGHGAGGGGGSSSNSGGGTLREELYVLLTHSYGFEEEDVIDALEHIPPTMARSVALATCVEILSGEQSVEPVGSSEVTVGNRQGKCAASSRPATSSSTAASSSSAEASSSSSVAAYSPAALAQAPRPFGASAPSSSSAPPSSSTSMAGGAEDGGADGADVQTLVEMMNCAPAHAQAALALCNHDMEAAIEHLMAREAAAATGDGPNDDDHLALEIAPDIDQQVAASIIRQAEEAEAAARVEAAVRAAEEAEARAAAEEAEAVVRAAEEAEAAAAVEVAARNEGAALAMVIEQQRADAVQAQERASHAEQEALRERVRRFYFDEGASGREMHLLNLDATQEALVLSFAAELSQSGAHVVVCKPQDTGRDHVLHLKKRRKELRPSPPSPPTVADRTALGEQPPPPPSAWLQPSSAPPPPLPDYNDHSRNLQVVGAPAPAPTPVPPPQQSPPSPAAPVPPPVSASGAFRNRLPPPGPVQIGGSSREELSDSIAPLALSLPFRLMYECEVLIGLKRLTPIRHWSPGFLAAIHRCSAEDGEATAVAVLRAMQTEPVSESISLFSMLRDRYVATASVAGAAAAVSRTRGRSIEVLRAVHLCPSGLTVARPSEKQASNRVLRAVHDCCGSTDYLIRVTAAAANRACLNAHTRTLHRALAFALHPRTYIAPSPGVGGIPSYALRMHALRHMAPLIYTYVRLCALPRTRRCPLSTTSHTRRSLTSRSSRTPMRSPATPRSAYATRRWPSLYARSANGASESAHSARVLPTSPPPTSGAQSSLRSPTASSWVESSSSGWRRPPRR